MNKLREINTHDLRFKAYDAADSWAAVSIAREIKDQYFIEGLELDPYDVIVDIGAHVGIFSMYYALKYPRAQIFSYEPTRRNYTNFVKSLEYNKIKNVNANNLAVTSDGRKVSLYQPSDNTGASSMFYNTSMEFQEKNEAESITLNDLFEDVKNKTSQRLFESKIKILKIDCEGAEFEILKDNLDLLKNVEYVMGELHHVANKPEFNAYVLYESISKIVGADKNRLTIIQTNTII